MLAIDHNLFPLAMSEDILVGSFGVAAAVLLVGGSVVIRWQRNRQQFLLMQTALLQGLKEFPAGPPPWVATLRQGITTLALGLGLIVVGSIAWLMGARVEPPTAIEISRAGQSAPAIQRPQQPPPQSLRSQRGPRADGRPGEPPPREPQLGEPPQGPPGFDDPRNGDPRNGDPRNGDPRNGAPRDVDPRDSGPRNGNVVIPGQPPRQVPFPAMERWHFAQAEQTVGLLAVGSGIVLTLLGLVHVGFSGVERRHMPVRPSVDPTTGV